MKTKSPLLRELITRTALGAKKAEKIKKQKEKQERREKIEEDVLYAKTIIAGLPEKMKQTADKGEERRHLVVYNTEVRHPRAIKMIVSYLKKEGFHTKLVHDMDPGSDTEWTELWAIW